MNLLEFPQRNMGRVRKSRSMDAAGLLSLMLLERDGGAVPPNVARFDQRNGVELPERSPELLFTMLVWNVLTAEQQERIQSTLRIMAYGDPADKWALQLHNLLTGKC